MARERKKSPTLLIKCLLGVPVLPGAQSDFWPTVLSRGRRGYQKSEPGGDHYDVGCLWPTHVLLFSSFFSRGKSPGIMRDMVDGTYFFCLFFQGKCVLQHVREFWNYKVHDGWDLFRLFFQGCNSSAHWRILGLQNP